MGSSSTRIRTENATSSSLPRVSPHTAGRTRATTESAGLTTDADEVDALNDIIMAVDMRGRGDVGCAYYVAQEETIYCMEDVKIGGPDIVEGCKSFAPFQRVFQAHMGSVKIYVEPTAILVPTKADDALIDRLDPEIRARSSTAESRRRSRMN